MNERLPQIAQLTFLLNPSLGAGYAYTISNDHQLILFAGFVALLGLIYNSGALMFYSFSMKVLTATLVRLTEIEQHTGGQLHKVFSDHWPHFYSKKAGLWKTKNSQVASVDLLAKIFFVILICGWLAALLRLFLVYLRALISMFKRA